MTKPDFRKWAYNIVALANFNGAALEEIETALIQAYEQGYHLGHGEGYENGVNYGWADIQDRDLRDADKEDN